MDFFRTKKDYVENAVKTAFDLQTTPHPSQYHPSSSKDNTDFLDRQIFEKADLDYIPGLDYDLGPVFLPSRIFFCLEEKRSRFVDGLASLDKLPGMDESAAAAKARADEEARKKVAAAAAEAEARRREQVTRVVKPILPHSSMFIFSSTNP